MRERYILSAFYILTGIFSIAISPHYAEAGVKAFENPAEVTNSIYYFLMIIGFTVFILLLAKFKGFLKVIFYILIFLTYIYAFTPFFGYLSFVLSLILLYLLIKKRNWIVINLSALLIAASITAIFGISFEPLPAIILLLALAIYDFIAVYKTGHMLKLADSVSELSIPILFIIPRRDKNAIMGVGDVVIPNILAVSAFFFNHCLVQAMLTIAFGYVGLIILMNYIEKKGGAHAGLPFLNTGAIIGYLIGFLFCH